MRRIRWTLALLGAAFLLSLLGLRPPAPKPPSAKPAEFSAERALQVLRRVLPDEKPHPVGSPDDDAVRTRILAELTALGYKPEVHTGVGCGRYGNCATVNNIVARLDPPQANAAVAGQVPAGSGAILLAAHYDSVPAGPGFSDDGVGVAALLEVARAVRASPAPRHPVIFLIDEGEEAGLLGAEAFVNSDPWASEVRAAVNVDARGTSGPSYMFETGDASAWAVQLFSPRASHPNASSVFYTVYKMLPNDTDFTVFKRAGYQGLNFAFLGGVAHYHTPLDNAENVSSASLQHEGDNALAAVEGLANADLSRPATGEAVFFDIFGQRVISWKAGRSLGAAIAATILLLLEIFWLIHRERMTARELAWGAAAWLAVVVITGALSFLLSRALRVAGAAPVNWIAHPLLMEISFWMLGATLLWANARAFAGRAGFWGLWSGGWIWWALLAIGTSWRLVGVSYVPLVPLVVAAVCVLPEIFAAPGKVDWRLIAIAAPLTIAGVLWFPLLLSLYSAAGFPTLVPISIAFALLLTPAMPLEADLRTAPGSRGAILFAAPFLVWVVATLLASVMPAFSAKSPERLNFQFWEDSDSGKSQWIARPESGRLPEPVRVAARFSQQAGPFPWDKRSVFAAAAPDLDLSPPTFTVLVSGTEAGRRTYRMLLRSERGAQAAEVYFPPDVDMRLIKMAGEALPPQAARYVRGYNGWTVLSSPAMTPMGVEMLLSLGVDRPVTVYVSDESYGLPMEGTFLLHARPLTASPSQSGDVSIVTRSIELNP